MASVVVIGHLTASGKAARDKIIRALSGVMRYSRDHEPGVLRFCIAVPRDPSDEGSVYAVEEYADQAALDSHMATSAVAGILDFFGSDPSMFARATDVWNMKTVASFTRPEVDENVNPVIELATFNFSEETKPELRKGCSTFVRAAEQDEQGTLSFAAWEDNNAPLTVRILKVWKGEPQESLTQQVSWRAESTSVALRKVAGYLYKGS